MEEDDDHQIYMKKPNKYKLRTKIPIALIIGIIYLLGIVIGIAIFIYYR